MLRGGVRRTRSRHPGPRAPRTVEPSQGRFNATCRLVVPRTPPRSDAALGETPSRLTDDAEGYVVAAAGCSGRALIGSSRIISDMAVARKAISAADMNAGP